MATVYSTRSCIPKLCCSLAAVGLFIAGILITGAYPHSNLNNFNLNQTHKEQNITSPGNFTLAAETLAFIQATNKEIYDQMDKALDRIERSMRRIPELAERMSRSTRAVQPSQALDQAGAIFEHYKPEPEYQLSEYATGNRRWKRAPRVHPVEITELLNYEVQTKNNKNKILGDKVAQILKQNTDLSDKISEEYQTPSEKLKKDPIMALVTRTISTYMLIKHSKNGKEKSQTENLSPWGEPFFSKQDHTTSHQHKSRMPRSPGSGETTKEETTTEWFLRNLATSPFPIQTIRTLGKALNILTNSSPENK
jgi:ribosome-associated translation inhibitor RaiA